MFTPISFQQPQLVTSGLVLYLDAADRTSYPAYGNTCRNLSGVNNGTLTNGPTYNSGNGGSIVFDGVDDFVAFSGNSYNIGVNFTIQTWVKIAVFGGGPNFQRASIVTNGYPYQSNQGFWMSCTSQAGPANNYVATPGAETFFLSIGADNFGVAPITGSLSAFVNKWVNLAVTVNGTAPMKCYINGIQPSSYAVQSNGPSSITYGNYPFSLGNRNNTAEYLNGAIANFSMYNRAQPDSEVLQNFNAQRQRFNI